MPEVIGVQFKEVSKIYYFNPGRFTDAAPGEWVVVDTSQGKEVVQVVQPVHEVPKDDIPGALRPVVRRANAWDMVQKDQYAHREAEVVPICKEKVRQHKLNMKIVGAQYSFDGGRLQIFFGAEKRVDFRTLVRDLARTFRTRIEMKQVGARDEAKLLDGVGKCGRQLCCTSWLREFTPISIRMARNQSLPLNPSEITGVCGRLLCCLSYEEAIYTDAKKTLPKVGARIVTTHGAGRVRHVNALRETVTVMLETESLVEVTADEIIDGKNSGSGRSCGTCGGCTVKRRASTNQDSDSEKQ